MRGEGWNVESEAHNLMGWQQQIFIATVPSVPPLGLD